MKLLDQSAQTNWKFIAIVAFVAVFLAGGILMLILQLEEPTMSLSPPVISSPNGNDSNNQVLDTSAWQTYRNDELGFEIKYPSEGEITETAYGPRITLPLEDPGTNLSEKYLDIAVDGPSAHTGELVASEQVYFGGNVFTKEIRGGVGAGNRYDTESYTINYEGRKYNLSFTLHSGNILNYDPSVRPKEFNQDQERKIFDQILATFRFVE